MKTVRGDWVWIMDCSIWDADNQLAKFNMDRHAVCDCGDADKHGKYVRGQARDCDSEMYAGVYWLRPGSAD